MRRSPGIQRIFLDAQGHKLGRKMLGVVSAAAVKLDPAEDATGIGIAEGLETALSVRARGWHPVWCLGSAGAIRNLPVAPGIEAVSIFADNDEKGDGLKAAQTCAWRWRKAGREARCRSCCLASARAR